MIRREIHTIFDTRFARTGRAEESAVAGKVPVRGQSVVLPLDVVRRVSAEVVVEGVGVLLRAGHAVHKTRSKISKY